MHFKVGLTKLSVESSPAELVYLTLTSTRRLAGRKLYLMKMGTMMTAGPLEPKSISHSVIGSSSDKGKG